MITALSYFDVFLTASNIFLFLYILSHFFARKRSWAFMIFIFTSKVILINYFLYHFMTPYIEEYEFLTYVCAFIQICHTILATWGLIYTFKGNPFIVILTGILIEAYVTICTYINSNIVSFVGAHLFKSIPSDYFSVIVPFATFSENYFIIKYIKCFINSIRKTTFSLLNNRYFYLVFIILYIIITSILNFFFLSNTLRDMWAYISNIAMATLVFLAAIAVLLYNTYQIRIVRKNNFLKKQMSFIKTYNSGVYQQIGIIQKERINMNSQISQIIEETLYSQNSERIKSYIAELKKQYNQIGINVYSKNHLLDSVLNNMEQQFKSRNIKYNFDIQSCGETIISSEILSELLFYMLNLVKKNTLSLKTKLLFNSLMIEIVCKDIRHSYSIRKILQRELPENSFELYKDKTIRGKYLIMIKQNSSCQMKDNIFVQDQKQ